ncbi:MAG: hypothetical protein KGJ79_15105 [Alphaproteobacteria bacterium]|nr:hypothetical protein [Alphaproteobacteria bacterium]MDE2493992.1 hypothetical protein [Alphaproteobacteria bacterium]
MQFVKSIVLFLLGVGFAAGIYISGFGQRIPGLMARAERGLGIHDGSFPKDGTPIFVRLSSPSEDANAGCEPFYRLDNRTGANLFVSFSRGENGNRLSGDAVRIPPGGKLVPNDRRPHDVENELDCSPQAIDIEFDNG